MVGGWPENVNPRKAAHLKPQGSIASVRIRDDIRRGGRETEINASRIGTIPPPLAGQAGMDRT
jgi:hypothetical protein